LDNDGENLLTRCADLPIDDCEICMASQNEIEQQCAVAQKFLSKAAKFEKAALVSEKIASFSVRLEGAKRRVANAVRLHELLDSDGAEMDEPLRHEMLDLVEKCESEMLRDRCQDKLRIRTSTPEKKFKSSIMLYIEDQANSVQQSCNEDEDHSKLTDSGIGGCSHCEGNLDILRSCSCQSFDKS
jgi:hypothetical protein